MQISTVIIDSRVDQFAAIQLADWMIHELLSICGPKMFQQSNVSTNVYSKHVIAVSS